MRAGSGILRENIMLFCHLAALLSKMNGTDTITNPSIKSAKHTKFRLSDDLPLRCHTRQWCPESVAQTVGE